jgi:hypothetical protein
MPVVRWKEILMTKNVLFGVLLIAMVACAAPRPTGTDGTRAEDEVVEIPPEGSLLLSEIVASIEIAGHTTITRVEFEDGAWEVEFVVGGEEYELEIDPMTGEALSEEPQKPDDD